ncbi:polysaccharide deacetylase family protein [Niabella beijingensis]|uniref:polysaccharide deacetylase family protein n=1 Tax=Niabella beijingensis TaxID=2872700 RepID=UPI001CBB3807|nr:polysaccharide deacetylase family protein [Niabella beijingensis]MBZ4189821.1 polysaccharide deacetylase family protein [Niabella beijingensis]
MLTFRNTTVAFLLLLAVLVYLQVRLNWPWYGYFIWFSAYTLLLFYGSFYIGSGFYMPVICRGKTDRKQISISFDDGPLEKYTPEVLAILKEKQAPATFFCIGYRVAEHEELLRQMIAGGHIIGNHSYYHDFWFDMHSAKRMQAELQQMQVLVHHITGKQMKWFRPPYGVTNPNVRKAAQAMGYTAVGWNVRSLDTMIRDEEKLLTKVKKGLSPGAVFLFHDTSHATVQILPRFLEYVKEQGYEVVPLDKLINLHPYA